MKTPEPVRPTPSSYFSIVFAVRPISSCRPLGNLFFHRPPIDRGRNRRRLVGSGPLASRTSATSPSLNSSSCAPTRGGDRGQYRPFGPVRSRGAPGAAGRPAPLPPARPPDRSGSAAPRGPGRPRSTRPTGGRARDAAPARPGGSRGGGTPGAGGGGGRLRVAGAKSPPFASHRRRAAADRAGVEGRRARQAVRRRIGGAGPRARRPCPVSLESDYLLYKYLL